jgi:hypothetical protein
LTGSVPKQTKVEVRRLALNPKQYTEFLAGFAASVKAELSPVDLRACVSETYFVAESLIQLIRYIIFLLPSSCAKLLIFKHTNKPINHSPMKFPLKISSNKILHYYPCKF